VKTLAVRGAPAIGLAGISALALWAAQAQSVDECEAVAEEIATARPTAVNLRWAVERGLAETETMRASGDISALADALFDLAVHMQAEDEATNRAIGSHGARLIEPGSRILTHCNAGSLGTYFYGTALGIVYAAAEQGKVERVYADETRPVGQGARLTAWELARAGVPVTLICDNMAASLMAAGQVDAVIVGADRIAANGDTANKIGTYGVAVLAHEHGIPFYVAAPCSTIDRSLPNGSLIPIEQRDAREVLPTPVEGVEVWNPAFDVTPARYITAIVTEKGVFAPAEL
jgi:methylthioribose-1-phosphate isomerase